MKWRNFTSEHGLSHAARLIDAMQHRAAAIGCPSSTLFVAAWSPLAAATRVRFGLIG
jgi:hypothetical protein